MKIPRMRVFFSSIKAKLVHGFFKQSSFLESKRKDRMTRVIEKTYFHSHRWMNDFLCHLISP